MLFIPKKIRRAHISKYIKRVSHISVLLS